MAYKLIQKTVAEPGVAARISSVSRVFKSAIIQPIRLNAGPVYIGDMDAGPNTGFEIFGPPAPDTPLDSVRLDGGTSNSNDLYELWIKVDSAGDGVNILYEEF